MSKQIPFERDASAPARAESPRNEKGTAMEMIRSESANMRDKTSRLRTQRLAREAAEAEAAVVPEKPKRAPRKTVAAKAAKAAKA